MARQTAERSPVTRLEAMVKLLTSELARGDSAAQDRVRRYAPNLDEAALARSGAEHARHTVLRECGLQGWDAACELLEGRLRPGADYGQFWWEASTDVLLSDWCVDYAEACRVRQESGRGCVLPYKRQFAVVQDEYLEELGLEPRDQAWAAIGHDLATPADAVAYRRLALRRLRNKGERHAALPRRASPELEVRPGRRGIYLVRCHATGAAWVDWVPNLDAVRNGLWFFLRHGQHLNPRMQAMWNTHGADTFEYQVLEEFDADLTPYRLEKLASERKQHWQDVYQAGEPLF